MHIDLENDEDLKKLDTVLKITKHIESLKVILIGGEDKKLGVKSKDKPKPKGSLTVEQRTM